MNKRLVGIFLLLLIITSNLPLAFNGLVKAEESDDSGIQTVESELFLENSILALDENITAPNELQLLTNYTQSILDNGWPVVLFFHADWCYFCQAMKPNVDIAESVYREKAVFLRINEANSSEIVEFYGVEAFPTILVLDPDLSILKISGYKEIDVLLNELYLAFEGVELASYSSQCSDPIGGFFNHYSCSFADCLDACTDEKVINWDSIQQEAIDTAISCCGLDAFSNSYACTKAWTTGDPSDTASCLAGLLGSYGGMPIGCPYSLGHLLADMLGAQQLGECLGQCTADASSYGQLCRPGAQQTSCKSNSFIGMDECVDCEWRYVDNSVSPCGPGEVCVSTRDGASCRDPDEDDDRDDPDKPPKRPPTKPGYDHPDDNYDISTGWLDSQFTWFGSSNSGGDVAILNRGFPLIQYGFVDWYRSIYDGEDPELIDITNIPYLNPAEYPVLILPTGSLYGLAGVEYVRESFESYTRLGGTLIAFTQQSGTEFELLPGGEIKGYGWQEDTSCIYNAAGITEYHPIFSGIDSNYFHNLPFPAGADGFFLEVPENSKILLTRIKNHTPAMIEYEYGAGTVIATTLYSDLIIMTHGLHAGSPANSKMIKNMLVFGRSEKPVPVVQPDLVDPVIVKINFTNPLIASQDWALFSRGSLVEKDIQVTNYNTTDIDLVSFTVLDPWYNQHVVNVSQTIAPGEEATVPFSLPTSSDSPAGIWIILYDLFQGNEWRGSSYSGAFALDIDLGKLTSFKTLYNITDPEGNLIDQGEVSFNLDPGHSTNIEISLEANTEGLWKIDYRIETIDGLVARNGRQAVAVTSIEHISNGFTVTPDFRISITSDHEHYPAQADAEFTVHLWNNAPEDKEVLIALSFPRHYLKTQNWEKYGTSNVASYTWGSRLNATLTVPAGEYMSYTYVVRLAAVQDSCWVRVSENHGTEEAPVYSFLTSSRKIVWPAGIGGRVYLEQDTNDVGQIVVPVTILGHSSIEGINRFTFQIKDSHGNDKWYTEFEKYIEPKRRYTQNITVPIDETWTEPIYSYEAKTYCKIDDWDYTWSSYNGHLVIPEVDVDMKIGGSYRVGDTVHLNLTYSNPVNLQWTQYTELLVNDFSLVQQETINLPPRGTYTSHISFEVPEGASAGNHQALLHLEQDDRYFNRMIVVPMSNLVTSVPESLVLGEQTSVNITNQGGVPADCEYSFKIQDIYGEEIVSQTGTKTINAGKSLKLNYTLSDQLINTRYTVSVTTNNLDTLKTKKTRVMYDVDGLAAKLVLSLDKPVYQTGETIQFTTDIENHDGEIIDGTLELEITSTEPQSLPTCVVPVDDMVITEDTVLCPGVYMISDEGSQGIISFGADDVVLDGNGAVIIGGGSGTAIRDGGHTGVTIKNLVINNYDYGISMLGSENIVQNVQVEETTTGIKLSSSCDHNKILDCTFNDCYYGIDSYSDQDIIQGNYFDTDTNTGVYISGSRDVVLYDNLFEGNNLGLKYYGSTYSMPGNITLRKNVFDGNSQAVRFEKGSQGNTITENTFSDNSQGLFLQGSTDNSITHNLIEDTGHYGIQLYTGCDRNIIAYNTFNRNEDGLHLWYWDALMQNPPPLQDNIIVSNSFTDNTQTGILLERDIDGTLIANNTISGISTATGINFIGRVNLATVVNNTITGIRYAIKFDPTVVVYPKDNLAYRNVDEGAYQSRGSYSLDYPNSWNTGTEGNYWNTYSGSDTNGDWIGETPYSAWYITDQHPYVEKYKWPRYDLTAVYSQITTLPWSTLGPYTIPEAGSPTPGTGGETMWETSQPFNLVDQYLETFTPTSLSEEGKYYLSGQIFSSTGQLLLFNSSSFYVSDSDIYLKLETDKPAYLSMENVEVNATIINSGLTQQTVTLTLSANGTAFYNDQHIINAGEHESIIAITNSDKNIELDAEIDGFAVTEIIPVHSPSITASIILPTIATHQTQPVALEIINDGKVPVTLNVDMLDIDTTITLQPQETTLLETEVSVLADTTVTATITGDVETTIQESMLFGEAVTASLTPMEAYLEGEVPVEYSLENTGIVDSYMDILFTIDGQEITKSVVVPIGGTITGRQSFNLTAGLYTLSLETPFETITEKINVESPPIFDIIDHPETLDYNLGDLAVIPFTIKNTGVTGGTAHITMEAESVWEETFNIMLDSEEESEESFILPLPDDMETTVLTVTLSVDDKQYQTEITLNGVELDVDAVLDKTLYQLGEDAQLTINLSNLNDVELELLVLVGLGEYSEEREFTLTSLESTNLVFTVPASFDEKLTYSVYINSGRAVHINRLYLYEQPDPSAGISLYTDKQVYEKDETVSMTVETTVPGTLSLTAPGYEVEEAIDIGTHSYSFTVPTLRTGTYYIEYSYEGYEDTYPIDIIGYTAKPTGVVLSKTEYEVGDDIVLTLTIDANTGFDGLVSAWILNPDNDPIGNTKIDYTFLEGENTVVLTIPLDTDKPGLHGFAYKIYAYGSIIWLNSGGGYFDVEDTIPPITTIISPTTQTYHTTSVPLEYKVNEETQWMQYSLDGGANVTLSGNTTLTGLTKTTHTLTIYAKDLNENTGKSTVTFTVTTSGGVVTGPTGPTSTPTLLPVTLKPATNITKESLALSWSTSDSSYFKEYKIYQSFTAGDLGTEITNLNEKTENTYIISGLTENTVYYYTIRVIDTYTQRADSNQLKVSTLASDSIPPTITIISPVNTTTPPDYNLDWTTDENLSYITVSIDGGKNTTLTEDYNFTYLTPGLHKVVIYASDISGNLVKQMFTLNVEASDNTSPELVHFSVENALETEPLSIYVVARDENNVEDVTLYWRETGDTLFNAVSMVMCDGCVNAYSAEIDPSGLSEIEYYVYASDGVNQATVPIDAPNQLFAVTVNQAPETVPLSVVDVTSDTIALSWEPIDIDDFDNYTLYLSTVVGEHGEEYSSFMDVGDSGITVEGLSSDSTYYLSLRVYDNAGQYSDSLPVMVTTLAKGGISPLVLGGLVLLVLAGVAYYLVKIKGIDLDNFLKAITNVKPLKHNKIICSYNIFNGTQLIWRQ